MNKIVDLHTHIVPKVDDGSRSIEESLEMLRIYKKQGVTDVFCTSHNGYSLEDGERYNEQLNNLRELAKQTGVTITLHQGCEVLCAEEYIDDIIYGLDVGVFATLGYSKYVLTELYTDTRPSEALKIIETLQKNGYKPIIAHMERNYNITGIMVALLIQRGALIQVNAQSFVEGRPEVTTIARELLSNQYVHFIGSDAHRINVRTPNMTAGIKYVLDNCDIEYSRKVLYENAIQLIIT